MRELVARKGTVLDKCLKGMRYAIYYSDFNNFECINGNYGYEEGNRVLTEYETLLKGVEGALSAYRVYSDYFMLVVGGRTKLEICKKMEDLNSGFIWELRRRYPGNSISIASGLYFLEKDDYESDMMRAVENANMARKFCKERGGTHCKIYSEDIRIQKEQEQQVAGQVIRALNEGRIELFLQPKYTLNEHKMIGAEALVRWKNEDGTYNSPGRFIPILEKNEFIVELDFYIYELVLQNMRRWKENGQKLFPISVNFSRMNLQRNNFVSRVIRLAERYKVDKEFIEIEITESTLSSSNEKMIRDMARLRQAGFKVDIDDFGTGYSSLNMLITAPVDTVKVDKSFVDNITESEKDRNYMNCIASLIRAADKNIIFEGVETEQQAKIISDLGYNQVQGFLFGRPAPILLFEETYLMDLC